MSKRRRKSPAEVIEIQAFEDPWAFQFPKRGRMWWSGDGFFLEWVIAATKEYWDTRPCYYDKTFKNDNQLYSEARRKADRKAWKRDLLELRKEARIQADDFGGRSYEKLFKLLDKTMPHFWH